MSDTTSEGFFRGAEKGVKLKLVGLGVLAVLVTTFSGWLIYAVLTVKPYVASRHPTHDASLDHHDAPEFSHLYEIKQMAIPVSNQRGNQTSVAQFTVVFDCRDEESKRQMMLHRPNIRNSIIVEAAGFRSEDFAEPKGFTRFREAILKNLQEYLGEHTPRKVIFKNWLMN